jgi:uncharacterized protein YfaS (alpha-2-macroglobulin family)/TolA-binding protein
MPARLAAATFWPIIGLMTLGLLLGPAPRAWAQPDDSQEHPLSRMAFRDYAGALQAITTRLAAGPAAEEAVLLRLLEARALVELGRAAEAEPKIRALADTGSPWQAQAHFILAECLLARGESRAAAAIYRQARSTHAGHTAHAALAARYRQLADHALQEKDDPSDPARAATLLAAARTLEPDADRARDDLAAQATAHQQAGAHAEAIARWSELLDDPAANDSLQARALHQRALARLSNTEPQPSKRSKRESGPAHDTIAAARNDLRALIERFPTSDRVPAALLALGESHAQSSHAAERERALTWWADLIQRFPNRDEARLASFRMGEIQRAADDAAAAVAAWDRHASHYPDDPRTADALFLAAEATLQLGRHAEAEQRFTDYLRRYPTGERWRIARERLEDAAYAAAAPLRHAGNLEPAEQALTRYLEQYPAGRHAPVALLERGRILRQLDRHEPAAAVWRTLAARFGTEAAAHSALLELAAMLETRGQLDEAVAELERLIAAAPQSGQANEARERLAGLRAIELELATPRAFRAGESATLVLDTRNLTSYELLIHRFDLANHILRHRSLAGIAGVATEIVAPELRKENRIEPYHRFRRIRSELTLPCDGPGAWIVEVRTAERRAKTLVIKSDIDLVARVAQREAVAFVTVSGAPVAGVRIAAHHAGGELATAVSGDDGLVRLRWATEQRDVRLLATRGEHTAFATGSVPSAPTAQLAPTGLLYTDRPLYRPGETVGYRLLLRDAREGRFEIPNGATANVIAIDPRGLEVAQARLVVDDYGACHGQLQLADEPALGNYRLVAHLDLPAGQASFEGAFWVEAYQLPPYEVNVEASSTVLAPGDTANANLDVRYRFGGPVAGARVDWFVLELPFAFDASRYEDYAWFLAPQRTDADRSGRLVHTANTTSDEAGRARFTWNLPRDERELRYLIAARVTDSAGASADGAAQILAVTRRHHAILRADRNVYRPGERARIRLLTVTADHQPDALEGRLLVERNDPQGWTPVSEQQVATDANGRLELDIALEQPARHRLSFRAADGGGFLGARALLELEVAGEAASRTLALHCERTVYREGEPARVFIATPAPNLRLLLTFEAEGIVSAQTLAVPGRAIEIELPMTAACAPNGFVTASVIHDGKLHEAKDAVIVLEYLDVRVECDPPSARPGDTVAITLTARDQRGRPLDTALSCAVVDSGVLALRPDTTPEVKSHFYNRRRHLGVTGCASTFSFHAQQLEPLQALLAEMRLKEEKKQLLALRELAREPNADPAAPQSELRDTLEKHSDDYRRKGGDREWANGDGAEPQKSAQTKSATAGENLGLMESIVAGGREVAELGELSELVARWRHRRDFRDTAAWLPTVVTGPSGQARVSVQLPDNLTRWHVTARGASRGAHLGEARSSILASQPLLAEIRAPQFLVERDVATATLEIHNATGAAARIAVGARQLDQPRDEPPTLDRQLELDAARVGRMPIELNAPRRGLQLVDLAVSSERHGDRLTAPLLVVPQGTRVLRAGAGRLASAAERRIPLPPYTDRQDARLLIGVDPDPDRSLERALDELRQFPYGCFEQTVSRFLPAVAAIHAYRVVGRPNDRLESRFLPIARAGVDRVLAMQNPEGGWGWWRDGKPEPIMTGYGLLALELCRTSGIVDVIPARIAAARKAAAAAITSATPQQQAFLLWALAYSEQQQLGAIRALHAQRERLDTATIALLALAIHRTGQLETLLPSLLQQLRDGAQRTADGLAWRGDDSFLGGPVEASALATLALATIAPDSDRDRIAAGCSELLARRQGLGWGTTKTSALAILALAHGRATVTAPLASITVHVDVNGTRAGSFIVDPKNPAQRHELVVPAELLRPDNLVVLDKQGEGTLYFWYRLEGFRRGKIVPDDNGITVRRTLAVAGEPGAPREEPGHTILVPEARPVLAPRSPQLVAVGERLAVELALDVAQPLDYVILEDPIAAGVAVEPGSAGGAFDRQETRIDRQVFFFTSLTPGRHVVRYHVRARFPGRFTLNPARAEAMYQPAIYGHDAAAALEIRARLDAREDQRTPDERYAQALQLVAKRHQPEVAQQADAACTALLALRLRPDIAAILLRHLIDLRAAAGGAPLLEAYEQLVTLEVAPAVAPAALARIADAYDDAGKALRALELYRALCDRFLDDVTHLANAYRAAADHDAAQNLLQDHLAVLPPTPHAIAARFEWAASFAQRHGAQLPPYHLALHALNQLAACWPASPHARLAALRRIEVHETLGSHPLAAREAARYLDVFDDPRRDLVLLALARNAFASNDFVAADRAAASLEHATYREGERELTSPHRAYATYLRAKIAHAQGRLADAIEGYRRVASQYDDANDAVAFYERKVLILPPIVRVLPGQPAALPLEHRNTPNVTFARYPVDLLTLFMMRGGQRAIDRVDLSGIEPAERILRQLIPTQGFELQHERVELGVLAPGAYLITGSTDDREVSCFLLVSDLQIRVQREGQRVYVHAARGDRPAAGVEVRIASGGNVVARGRTDARGVFDAPATGEIAVIAFDGPHHAIWTADQRQD